MNQNNEYHEDRRTPDEIARDLKIEALRRRRSVRYSARLRRHFFAGLLVVVPIGVTIWIVAWLVNLIDGKTR
ncbi:MAG: hypothetical protein KC940_03050, partial [Candidatus Omnitrophica bacterium]|nr:hypothetical protein [Candidatus Omnitrophota bacterium]